MKKPLIPIFLLLAIFLPIQAKSQIPSNFNIVWNGVSEQPSGQLWRTPVPRPPGKTTMYATFMFRGSSYFWNPTEKWRATGHHLGVIMRGPSYINGRGIIIGNVHRGAESSSELCKFPGTAQVEVFGTIPEEGSTASEYSGALFPTTCISDEIRLLDDTWYKAYVFVDDADYVSYSIDETTSSGTIIRTVKPTTSVKTTIAGDPPDGDGFSLVSTTGIGGLSWERPPFTMEIKNLSVTWL